MEKLEPRGDDPETWSLEEIESDELERRATVGARETDVAGLGGRHGSAANLFNPLVDEGFAHSLFDQEVSERERMIRGRPKGADLITDDSEEWSSSFEGGDAGATELDDVERLDGPDGDEGDVAGEEVLDGGEEEVKFEDRAGSFVFNTAARIVNLRDESLRFPAGLTYEDRRSLVEIHLPNLDAKIEAGMRPESEPFGRGGRATREAGAERADRLIPQSLLGEEARRP
jgi:hypothetical protein